MLRTIGGPLLAVMTLASCAGTSRMTDSEAPPRPQLDWSSSAADRPEEDGDGIWTGIFTEKGPADLRTVATLEKKLGRRFASVMWFIDFSAPFPSQDVQKVWDAGYVPNVTWEPWFWSDNEKIHLKDINDGTWDSYITEWGRTAAAFGKPLLVRWGHEFNGEWYPWAVAKNGEDPTAYLNAYRRVHDLVVKAGAQNVVWVWCPNAESVPPKPWNNPMLAYPGDRYVDWVALDGYDFDGNKTFEDIFARIYAEVLKNIPKPVFIGETATGRSAEAKAEWIQAMHDAIATKFPGLKGLIWFDIRKERDWRLDDSLASLKAARDVFSLPLYRSRPDAIPASAEVFDLGYSEYKEAAKNLVLVDRATVKVPHARVSASGVDWSTAAVIPVKSGTGPSGQVQLAWDSDRLYILSSIQDQHPLVNAKKADGIWDGDGLEFCLSTDPASPPDRGYFASTDWQLGFSTGDIASGLPPQTWEWTKLKTQVPGALVKAAPIDGGYRMEISVPWKSLSGFQPQQGMKLGFDLAVDDAGANGSRSFQWVWNGNGQFYNNPVQWGVLVLSE